ncbi:hypothetical protein [Amycolatopsis cihanbeyliensis]|uniref:Uncharacterized protein n=1 Tax=Amycolatopsis cihanbeyliensis TaxID=1128664 RepID=A0A542DG88_AMYCI|nr:hypothetical protein [Amycolatopsis cihanbeyliensis]TQJ02090.1 hypothetical protein FB471_1807 [Amycolatopsis cihanbeyliensis]
MKLSARGRQAPTEVKVTMALLVGIPVVYALLVLFMMVAVGATARGLMVPLTSLFFGGIVAAGIGRGHPFFRITGYVVVVLFAIAHVFALLVAAMLWVKLFSILAAAGYVYSGVLLNSLPMRRYVLGEDRA